MGTIRPSFWEADAFGEWDYLVVGGGIVGLSAAASIAETQPRARTLVLERGVLPTGASTRNAGFACFGSLTELLADLETLPPEAVRELVALRWEGLRRLRSRLTDAALGYQAKGGYEAVSEDDLPALARMEEANALLEPVFGGPVYSRRDELSEFFGFRPGFAKALVFNPFEGQLHPGKMMAALMAHLRRLGVAVLTGAEVLAVEETASGVEVRVSRKAAGGEVAFKAGKAAVCVNAFAKALLPEADLQPGRGMVLLTEPLDRLPFEGCFHSERGYYYFRDAPGGRVLLGGGRHLDMEGERTAEFGANPLIRAELMRMLAEDLLPNAEFSIESEWSGVMAFGASRQPLLEAVSPCVWAGVRLGGMGVAVGSELGERLARQMTAPASAA